MPQERNISSEGHVYSVAGMGEEEVSAYTETARRQLPRSAGIFSWTACEMGVLSKIDI